MTIAVQTPAERRIDLARRVDFAREALRPFAADDGYEGRLVRNAWWALAAVAQQLVEDLDA